MREQPPAAAARPGARDSAILLVVAVLAVVCGVVSVGLQTLQQTGPVTASATDGARSKPLPAGPQKYQ